MAKSEHCGIAVGAVGEGSERREVGHGEIDVGGMMERAQSAGGVLMGDAHCVRRILTGFK